ncbi:MULTISPECIES: hypothetical protein [unclassified Butyrivibrio]|uniref:hypothetical protein n=1 Tax=unclassified Butyrivibrio TaxID=2639466 RepID=UPI00047BB3AD|nr:MULTISPECIES: hypothetical protein [unclassified Butyrivibrio]
MCRVKKVDWSKIWVYIVVFVIILFMVKGMNKNSKYDVIRFGDTHFRLPNRITGGLDRIEGEDYVFLHSDDYLVLGVGPDCEGIDSDILEQFDISFEKIKEVNSIKNAYELTEFVGNNSGVVVDSGVSNKPSFDECFLQYRLEDIEKIIYFFTADNKSVIEIIVAPRGDISKKEIEEMYGSLAYSYY